MFKDRILGQLKLVANTFLLTMLENIYGEEKPSKMYKFKWCRTIPISVH